MKMRVRFFNGEVYDFPEVREETIAIDDKLISFVFRGGHVTSIALRSLLFIEEMADDEISEQVTQPIEDAEEIMDRPDPMMDMLRMAGGVPHVEEENSK